MGMSCQSPDKKPGFQRRCPVRIGTPLSGLNLFDFSHMSVLHPFLLSPKNICFAILSFLTSVKFQRSSRHYVCRVRL